MESGVDQSTTVPLCVRERCPAVSAQAAVSLVIRNRLYAAAAVSAEFSIRT